MKTKLLLAAIILLSSLSVFAQTEEEKMAKLAKATQNPLAAMYSVPFQNNTTFRGGANEDQTTNILFIQPVIPVSLGENINLISRIILPVITAPDADSGNSTGTGDTSWSAWFSPSKASKVTWGVGPVIQVPTASDVKYGTGEWGVGPSLVLLTSVDKWVMGFVTNNTWTFGEKEENKFVFQYFVNYNLPKAWYLVTGPIITADWNTETENRWIVPFGAGFGRVTKFGKLPVNMNLHAYHNTIRPDGYGNLTVRFQLQFLFPK